MTKYSGIDQHKRKGKNLIAPLNELPVKPLNWQRDVLPEYLWIEYLKQSQPNRIFLELYSEFCNVMRIYCEGNAAFLGLVSDFGRIPLGKRPEILYKYKNLVYRAFEHPFGKIVMLYPDAPCYWLLNTEWVKANEHNNDASKAQLTLTIQKLLPSKDPYCAYLRMIPLRRLFEEDKIHFTKNMEIVDLLPLYPHALNDDFRLKCESMGRSILNAVFPQHIDYKWAKYFWRHNFELSPCKIHKEPLSSQRVIDSNVQNKLTQICNYNLEALANYLNEVTNNYPFDLYTPEKDEVTLGLFSRIIRLASIILENTTLWSYDLSRIMLRCLSDTVITFCYLIHQNDDKLFDSFIYYGKGKEKLLLLHLQDTHPNETGPSGETTEIIADQLGGGVSPAMIDINLGDWVNVSARDMAKACDLLEIYRIIYDPTSSDIHGTWSSIHNVNLTYCTNPLHRYHRLPQMEPPPYFLQPLQITISLVQQSINFAQNNWRFPLMEKQLQTLENIIE